MFEKVPADIFLKKWKLMLTQKHCIWMFMDFIYNN